MKDGIEMITPHRFTDQSRPRKGRVPIVSVAVIIAVGVSSDCRREVLGMDTARAGAARISRIDGIS
jgi:hypothetical protein